MYCLFSVCYFFLISIHLSLHFLYIYGSILSNWYQRDRCKDGRRCEWFSRNDCPELTRLLRMEDLLIVKDLYEPISKSDIPTGVIESEWKILNRKVLATIRQCVDISILQHVASDTNDFELWHKLSVLYERKNALNKTSLMRKIVRLKYIDGDSIVVHISTFMGLVN